MNVMVPRGYQPCPNCRCGMKEAMASAGVVDRPTPNDMIVNIGIDQPAGSVTAVVLFLGFDPEAAEFFGSKQPRSARRSSSTDRAVAELAALTERPATNLGLSGDDERLAQRDLVTA